MTIKMAIRVRWMKERSRPASHFKYLCIMWWAPRVIFPEVERNRHANRSNTSRLSAQGGRPRLPLFGRREEPADRRPSPMVTMLPSLLFAAKAESLGLRAPATPLPAHTAKLAMSWHERTHADTRVSGTGATGCRRARCEEERVADCCRRTWRMSCARRW